ncbi:MAG: hypothetical protein ABI036_08280 [Fibrobacteria bacterium]
MKMKAKPSQSKWAIAALLAFLTLSGCKEELPIVYSERIAILPDKSGLLIKEVRSLDKSRNEMVVKEVVGKSVKEIFLIPLIDFQDVKFKFSLLHDTVHLMHTQPEFEKSIQAINPSAFTIKTESVSPVVWLTAGTIEGDPIFYAEDKWGAYFDLMRKD